MSEPDIYLASSSPRRQQLLAQIGVRFEQVAVTVSESRQLPETPRQFVERMALEKARAGWRSLDRPGPPVLGADTILNLDGEVLGKPRDREHGLELLQHLSGRSHTVLSSVALVGKHELVRVQESRVTFRTITASECRKYWDTGEPLDKAGAYGIQGLGAIFIAHLEGSYSGVMGLPLFETAELLASFGIVIINNESLYE